MSDFFFNCNSEFFEIRSSMLAHVKKKESIWIKDFGIDMCRIERNFFKQFEKLDKLMTKFECRSHSVFRFPPNSCYGWHIDNPGRTCALNMLLEGTDSHTFCGNPGEVFNKKIVDYNEISEIRYETNKFVLLNVQKPHTVFNLNNIRYILSISFHPDNGNFENIKNYLIDNNC